MPQYRTSNIQHAIAGPEHHPRPFFGRSTPFSTKMIIISIAFFLLAFCNTAAADDVGITKARLIQKTENSYILEADINQQLMWTIKSPIFPDRFQVSEPEYTQQSGWIVVQVTASTTGDPLSANDEILLPWMRNGAALSVQWLDGSISQGLFMRSLEGIQVPLRLLLPDRKSLPELCIEHLSNGFGHLFFRGIHLLIIAALVIMLPTNRLFNSLLIMTLGQASALILADIGLPGVEMLFADILGSLLILMLAYAVVKDLPAKGYFPVLFLFGLLHALAYHQELFALDLPIDQQLPALFMFNIAIDIGHFAAAGLLLLILKLLTKLKSLKMIVGYSLGTLAVMLFLILFQEHLLAGKTDILNFSANRNATQFSLPASQNSPGGGQRPAGARQLTSPIMNYLSVEPYEVRQEILIQARAAVQFIGLNDAGKGSILAGSQATVKKEILEFVQRQNQLSIDGETIAPLLTRADFVTLGPAGVIVRETPIPESLDGGIIGLTLVYETDDIADEITLTWQSFSELVQQVEATTTDPFGSATMILSPDDNILRWKSRLSGYQVPVISEITVEKIKLPLISIGLFLLVAILYVLSTRREKPLLSHPVMMGILGIGFLLYPFARSSANLPFISQWQPSTERTSVILDDLLTNVYRAFDVRGESDVYDRLEMSVIGDQLTQIYLQNRRTMELENRGGARANVDDVEILAINEVRGTEDGEGFVADARWIVSGSVSHFGHTHYRRNQFHALVTFVIDGNSWKIRDIDLIEEERLL